MNIVDRNLTCFFHPIKIIFLDDNPAFLEAIELEFGEKINLILLTDPNQALEIISKYSQDITHTIYKLITNVNTDTSNNRSIGFDFSKTLEFIYDKERFNHAPVLVIDYEMPIINGIEF